MHFSQLDSLIMISQIASIDSEPVMVSGLAAVTHSLSPILCPFKELSSTHNLSDKLDKQTNREFDSRLLLIFVLKIVLHLR